MHTRHGTEVRAGRGGHPAYFHARACAFVLWLLVQPTVERVLIDARAVAASRPKV